MTQQRIAELEKAERKLNALEAGGVDNWEFYDVALESIIKEEEIEDSISDALQEILEALSDGVYEPSERGAGIAYAPESEAIALNIIRKLVYAQISNQ